MIDIYELIEKIQKRPSMYLGKPSISNLRAFLAGYNFSRRAMNIPQTEQEIKFENFQEWIQNKFNITSSQSWDNIIIFYSEDEKDALNQFFDLFEEFRKNLVNQQESSDSEQNISSVSKLA